MFADQANMSFYVLWHKRQPRKKGQFCDLPASPMPIEHFKKTDTANLTAARARLAELKFKEAADERLVTPPEELPSWKWWDPKRRRNYRDITHEFCGDPSLARSALGGWKQLGDEFDDAGHSDSERWLREIRRGEL